MTFKHFRKIELVCNTVSAALVVTGAAAGSVAANPILGTVSGTRLILKTYSEARSYKRKIEMCKFASPRTERYRRT